MIRKLRELFQRRGLLKKAGINPIGVYTHEPRDQVWSLRKEWYQCCLWLIPMVSLELSSHFCRKTITAIFQDLNEDKMKAEIERAEREADITIIMPQMGVEYRLEPTEEQKGLITR